jgi:hypothetical protein
MCRAIFSGLEPGPIVAFGDPRLVEVEGQGFVSEQVVDQGDVFL